jgi:A/G-specific adenine glycosylase
MPWRQPDSQGEFDPYAIMVSEIMLQQTQVSRVVPKYQEFIASFPTVSALAKASLGEVLKAWSGLGYNRRAQYLHQAAQQIGDGPFPQTMEALVRLPGVGVNTAAAIMNYAYNQPTPFIETNIRTVYIHHYFNDQPEPVNDKQLLPLIEETIDWEHPREWFWALMDYGAHLKATIGNLSRFSQHYAKQSAFQGSRRQVRGQIIRLLTQTSHSYEQLCQQIDDPRLSDILVELTQEGLIITAKNQYRTPSN